MGSASPQPGRTVTPMSLFELGPSNLSSNLNPRLHRSFSLLSSFLHTNTRFRTYFDICRSLSPFLTPCLFCRQERLALPRHMPANQHSRRRQNNAASAAKRHLSFDLAVSRDF